MSERDDLMIKLQQILMSYDIPAEEVRAKIYLALDQYEITARCTELVLADEETTDKYIKIFLLNKRVAGRTEGTLKKYNATLIMFFRECQKMPTDVTADDIKKFLAVKEVRDKASKIYLKSMFRDLQSFYTWMVKEEYMIKNPFNKVEDIKTPKIRKAAFTEMDIERLRASIPPEDLRLKLIFEMLMSTWCRASELAGIKVSDFSENKESVIVHGKGEKDRICYINARAKLSLEKYLEKRTDNNPYLFPKSKVRDFTDKEAMNEMRRIKKEELCNWWQNPEYIGEGAIKRDTIEEKIRKLGEKAGVEKTHPHRFRRTGATFALRRGMPIEQVSKLLGHESIETTQIYLDISETELEQSHRKYT